MKFVLEKTLSVYEEAKRYGYREACRCERFGRRLREGRLSSGVKGSEGHKRPKRSGER